MSCAIKRGWYRDAAPCNRVVPGPPPVDAAGGQLNLPSWDSVSAEVIKAIQKDHLSPEKVNSENQIEALSDESGQLRLRTPLNLFIGGQILDRGITIKNSIGFYLRAKSAEITTRHGVAALTYVWCSAT